MAGKRGATKLGFALLLRFYTERGRFPRGRARSRTPQWITWLVRCGGATEIAFYEWSGRTSKFHRAQIREALGFRECTVADAEAVTEWLVDERHAGRTSGERVREQVLARCRAERIEPPTAGRIDRIVRSALTAARSVLFARVSGRLSVEVWSRMLALVAGRRRRRGGRSDGVGVDPFGCGQRQLEHDADRDRQAGGGPRGRAAGRRVRRCRAEDRDRLAGPSGCRVAEPSARTTRPM